MQGTQKAPGRTQKAQKIALCFLRFLRSPWRFLCSSSNGDQQRAGDRGIAAASPSGGRPEALIFARIDASVKKWKKLRFSFVQGDVVKI
jgi:hypothetical protein